MVILNLIELLGLFAAMTALALAPSTSAKAILCLFHHCRCGFCQQHFSRARDSGCGGRRHLWFFLAYRAGLLFAYYVVSLFAYYVERYSTYWAHFAAYELHRVKDHQSTKQSLAPLS